MDAIEHLPDVAWKTPEAYFGFDPVGDYLILSRHRDSELVDESNWIIACKMLNAVDHDSADLDSRPPAYTFRAGHWGVGWVEYLLVRPDADEAVLQEAGEIICSLAEYSILNDHHFGELEFEAMCKTWERASVRERVRYLQRAHQCIFAARRDTLPEDGNGALQELLLGY